MDSLIYRELTIYIYTPSVYGSVVQSKTSKREVPGSTPSSSCFSLVFIKNLINNKSKHMTKMLLFILYCPGPLTVIYNTYKSIIYNTYKYDLLTGPFVSVNCIVFDIYIHVIQ